MVQSQSDICQLRLLEDILEGFTLWVWKLDLGIAIQVLTLLKLCQ